MTIYCDVRGGRMEPLKCGSCKKELNGKAEIEYSSWLTEYYCDPNCATERYFEYMGSRVLDAEGFDQDKVFFMNGKLYQKE